MKCTLGEHLKTCNRILFILIAWSASESKSATYTDPSCHSHTRSPEHVILTGGGTDKLLISASPWLPQDKLGAAVIRAFEWILANNSWRLPVTHGFTVHHLFIYLFILFVLGQNWGKQDWNSFCFLWKKSSMQNDKRITLQSENEIIHELFHPCCGDLCLVRLHDSVFLGPFDAPLLAVLWGWGIQIFI